MKHFIIVVDMQRDFVAADGALSVAGAQDLVAPMQAWLGALRAEDVAGVLFTCDTHDPEIYAQSPEAKQFPPHCERGTPGWTLVVDAGEIDPGIPIYSLEKGVFDMWAEPGLCLHRLDVHEAIDRDAFFARLQADGVEQGTVVGVAADFCVRWAVEGLIGRGFRVGIPAWLTRGIMRQIGDVAAQEWPGAPVSVAGPNA